MQSIFEVYGTWTPICPEGWKLGEFRKPAYGESYLGITDKGSWVWIGGNARPRFILEKLLPPPETTIKSVYGTNTPVIPEGWVSAGFRKLYAGETFLGVSSRPCVITESASYSPSSEENRVCRIILKPAPAPKTIRVVRVLEYVGTEEWVNKTLACNFATPQGAFALPGKAQIRELSTFCEEVKK